MEIYKNNIINSNPQKTDEYQNLSQNLANAKYCNDVDSGCAISVNAVNTEKENNELVTQMQDAKVEFNHKKVYFMRHGQTWFNKVAKMCKPPEFDYHAHMEENESQSHSKVSETATATETETATENPKLFEYDFGLEDFFLDTTLSPEGISQCKCPSLQDLLRNLNIDTILVSPLERTLMTVREVLPDALTDSIAASNNFYVIPSLIEVGSNSCDIPENYDNKKLDFWSKINYKYAFSFQNKIWGEWLFNIKINKNDLKVKELIEKSNPATQIHKESLKLLKERIDKKNYAPVKTKDILKILSKNYENGVRLEPRKDFRKRAIKAWEVIFSKLIPALPGSNILICGHSSFYRSITKVNLLNLEIDQVLYNGRKFTYKEVYSTKPIETIQDESLNGDLLEYFLDNTELFQQSDTGFTEEIIDTVILAEDPIDNLLAMEADGKGIDKTVYVDKILSNCCEECQKDKEKEKGKEKDKL